ncbi:MAG: GIY-YIG nuclease family protein, partial [Chlorobi bacterium]|nr:GIY-YIG nuclease family protein [Chlorobiota bacterium]
MATVYILYSKKMDSYYIGSCKDFNIRLEEH